MPRVPAGAAGLHSSSDYSDPGLSTSAALQYTVMLRMPSFERRYRAISVHHGTEHPRPPRQHEQQRKQAQQRDPEQLDAERGSLLRIQLLRRSTFIQTTGG